MFPSKFGAYVVKNFVFPKQRVSLGGFRSEGRTAAVKKQDEEGAGQTWIPGNVEAIALEIILFCFSTHCLQIRDFL